MSSSHIEIANATLSSGSFSKSSPALPGTLAQEWAWVGGGWWPRPKLWNDTSTVVMSSLYLLPVTHSPHQLPLLADYSPACTVRSASFTISLAAEGSESANTTCFAMCAAATFSHTPGYRDTDLFMYIQWTGGQGQHRQT